MKFEGDLWWKKYNNVAKKSLKNVWPAPWRGTVRITF
jgi:hypothetical protein